MISAAYAAEAAEAAHGHEVFYATAEFWVSVAFLVVVALAFRPVFRAIAAGLDNRATHIKAKLDESRKLREDAQALLADYQRKQRDALQEAEGIIAHAKTEAERLKREAEANLEASIGRREQQAMDRIAQAEQQALAEVRNQAVDIAMAATAKLIADKMDAAKQNALIDGAIKDLPNRLH